jgi:hypothetical protein
LMIAEYLATAQNGAALALRRTYSHAC